MSTDAPTDRSGDEAVRWVAVVHLAFAGVFAVVAVYYLVRTAAAGAGGPSDPKDWVPFGAQSLNPLIWFYGLFSLLYLVAPLLSPALLLVSVPLLARRWRGSGRRSRWLLLAGTVSAVALPLLRLTPFGAEMHRWWLD
jgi:uncharacterized membrane protein YhaH (DUF805 family)